MITLDPSYALRHCAKCGLRLSMDERLSILKREDGTYYHTYCCPLRSQCWYIDRIEEECDLTMVLPRVAGDDDA